MNVATLRIRCDRKTGAELDRQILNIEEMSQEGYAALLVRAMTGQSPQAAAADFLQWREKEEKQSA